MNIINLVIVTPNPRTQLNPIYINDSARSIKIATYNDVKTFSSNAFQLTAFEEKKDSIGNAEATAPFAYCFTTDVNYLLSGSLIEIYQTDRIDNLNLNDCVRVFEGYIGNIKQDSKTQYEIISNLFLLKRYSGKRISKYCYKTLGDAECGKDLTQHTFTVSITQGYDRGLNGLVLDGCPDIVNGGFTEGILRIRTTVDYPDARQLAAGDYHIYTDTRISATQRRIWLSQVGLASKIGPQNCVIVRGCAKDHLSCYNIFNNIENCGAFTFLPGNDRIFAGS